MWHRCETVNLIAKEAYLPKNKNLLSLICIRKPIKMLLNEGNWKVCKVRTHNLEVRFSLCIKEAIPLVNPSWNVDCQVASVTMFIRNDHWTISRDRWILSASLHSLPFKNHFIFSSIPRTIKSTPSVRTYNKTFLYISYLSQRYFHKLNTITIIAEEYK